MRGAMSESKKPARWEEVAADEWSETCRMAVPGGWLYRTIVYAADESANSVATTFVPETNT
jgi:hypothetical protein